jgi:hypothetical protein
MKSLTIIMMVMFLGCGGGGGDSPVDTAKAVDDPAQPPVIEPAPPEVVPEEPIPTPIPVPEEPTPTPLPAPEVPIAPALPKPAKPIPPSLPKPTPPPVVEPEPEPEKPRSESYSKSVVSSIYWTFTTDDGAVYTDISPFIIWYDKQSVSYVDIKQTIDGEVLFKDEERVPSWSFTSAEAVLDGEVYYDAYAETTSDGLYVEVSHSTEALSPAVYAVALVTGNFVVVQSGWLTMHYDFLVSFQGTVGSDNDYVYMDVGIDLFMGNNQNPNGSTHDTQEGWGSMDNDGPYPKEYGFLSDTPYESEVKSYYVAGEEGRFSAYAKGLSAISNR